MIVPATDVEAAQLLMFQYGYPGWSRNFEYAFRGEPSIMITTAMDGCKLVLVEGTHNLEELLLDFAAIAIPSRIGPVAGGFYYGVQHAVDRILEHAKGAPVRLAGHSRGAAVANDIGEEMRAIGYAPADMVKFGEPASRYATSSVIPQRSYWNRGLGGADPIYEVPLYLWPFLPYEHSCPPTMIDVAPTPEVTSEWKAKWGPLVALKPNILRHHMALYLQGIS